MTNSSFHYIGIATVAFGLSYAARLSYDLLRPSSISRYLRKDGNAWALVTGASDGIGLGFCHELAAKGFHLILHGRNPQKLERVIAQLEKDHPTLKTRTFIADACKGSSLEELAEVVKGLHLTVLVNNVGGAAAQPRAYMNLEEYSLEDIQTTLDFNAGFATKITKILLPTLISNEPSLILNIGSLSALGVPKLSVYAGTKGYTIAFSESLQSELVSQGKDVTVHGVWVAGVQSGGNTVDTSLSVPSSRVMAKATLSRVGSPTVAITPYVPHAMMMFFVTSLPTRLRQYALIEGARDSEAKLSKKE